MSDFGYILINFINNTQNTNAPLLFWEKDIAYITKKNSQGFYCTERMMKDPEYKGHRYLWASELGIKLNIL